MIRNIECLEKDCITDLVFLNKENFTLLKDLEENFTESESIIHNNVEYDEWNQVIKDNETSLEDDLPHYVVPEISSYERGEGVKDGKLPLRPKRKKMLIKKDTNKSQQLKIK